MACAHTVVVAHRERPRTLTECESRGQDRVVTVQVLHLGDAKDLACSFDRDSPERAEHEAIDADGVGLAPELDGRCAPREAYADRHGPPPESDDRIRGGKNGVRNQSRSISEDARVHARPPRGTVRPSDGSTDAIRTTSDLGATS